MKIVVNKIEKHQNYNNSKPQKSKGGYGGED